MALACFVAARLAADSAAPFEESSSRLARSAGAKAWLGTLTLPAPVRAQVTVLADLCVDAQAGMLSRELTVLSVAATPYLDAPSRGELEGLAASLRDSGP